MRAALLAALLASCDERGKSPADARSVPDVLILGDAIVDTPASSNPGFVFPNQPVAAWTETSPGTFAAATLDLSCLGVARVDPALGQQATVSATVRDFQSGNTLPGAPVTAFGGTSVSMVLASATADGGGVATLTIPQGTKRFGYKTEGASSRPTFTHDQLLASTSASVTITSVSNATVQTLPALVGVSATVDGSLLLGTITDCQGHLLSNAIATVSGVPGMAMHLPGIDTYYVSESVGLPVRHSQLAATSKNGMFMVIELPATPNAVIQVWGFRNAADLQTANLRILAELIVPVQTRSALVTRHDPRATR